MSERRTPYRAPRRRPLALQAPMRRLAALPPGDERAIAERLLIDLTAYYSVQGWRGVDGALAGRCRITIQALLGALEAAQRRETAGTETAAPKCCGAAVERAGPAEASSAALPLPKPRALEVAEWSATSIAAHANSETEGNADARFELGTVAPTSER
jgi:hypothetical protein